MGKFNLQKAKEGKPVRTKNGYPARIICFDALGNYPIIALITREGESEPIRTYREDGKYNGPNDSDYDLEMDTVKRTGYVNLYQYGRTMESMEVGCNISESESEAKKIGETRGKEYVTTVKIEWEE